MRVLHRLTATALLSAALPSGAATAVLYDPAAASLPSSQGWIFLTDPLFVSQARQSLADVSARLDSTANRTDKAGWFSSVPPLPRHPRLPALDASAGFVLSFSARVLSEDHVSPDRAGFSLIATASDLSAIELGFWTGEIWAQSGPDFRHAEGAVFDTAAGRTRYDLEVHAGRYRLSADGHLLLEGDLRRYDSFGSPYSIPEFVFLGDDTTSAQALAEVGRITAGPLPRLTASRTPAGIELALDADEARDVVFEASPGPGVWEAVGTVTASGGTARLTLPPKGEGRIFRARLR